MSDRDATPEEIAAAESLVEPILYGSGGGNEYERLPTIQEIALRLRALRQDKARLEWLYDTHIITLNQHGERNVIRFEWKFCDPDFRAAIDAAMSLSAETKTARTS